MAKNTREKLLKCRKGSEFIRFAERTDAEIRNGNGSHVVVKRGEERTVIPNHPRDLATGTRTSIIKAFIRMGLVVGVVAAWLCGWL